MAYIELSVNGVAIRNSMGAFLQSNALWDLKPHYWGVGMEEQAKTVASRNEKVIITHRKIKCEQDPEIEALENDPKYRRYASA